MCCLATTAFFCLATAAFAQSSSYSYDSLNRLTNVVYSNGSVISYTYDAAGNRMTCSGIATNGGDTVSPSISILSPTNGASYSTASNSVTLAGIASDNFGVSKITWQNEAAEFQFGLALGTTNWTIPSLPLHPGANHITLASYDLAGNSAKADITVTLSAVLPDYTITLGTMPSNGGTVSGSGSFVSGSHVTVSAAASNGFTFANWTENGAAVSSSNTYTFALDGDRTLVANFTVNPADISVTVQPNPSGLSFTVDGTNYTDSQTFTWVSGSSHSIATISPQTAGTGIQYVWTGWSDGDGISHPISPTSDTTYTANFSTPRFPLTRPSHPGTPLAWGWNTYGQSSVPEGLSAVVAVAAGYGHTVALRQDGTVVAWGWNRDGQTNVPVGLGGVVAVAAGGAHTVALLEDGNVVAWGANRDDNGRYCGQATVPAGLTGVVAVAAGVCHSVALKDDGNVVVWGANWNGQTNMPPGLGGVTAIAAGGYDTVALKQDGTVVAWGWNDSGQANVPPGLSGVMAVAMGFWHTVALEQDGTVLSWGYNGSGQTNVPDGLRNVVAIAAGGVQAVALEQDGTLVHWGVNNYGQTMPAGLSGVVAIAAGAYHTVAVTTNRYNESQYTLTVDANNGSVTRNPDLATYTWGSHVVLAATPADGYEFSNWVLPA